MSSLIDGRIDNQKIKERLLAYHYPSAYQPTEQFIDDIISEFWFRDFYNSLIAIPRFFDFLQQYLNDKCPITFVRADFYHYIFHKIISAYVEDSKIEFWFLYIKKIALVFEKLQTDTISLVDYEKIRKKDLNIENEMFSPDWLLTNQLITIEDTKGKKNLKWIHHTLTEYLVADFILQDPKPIQTAVNYLKLNKDGFEALKPSWYGVLRFLLESSLAKDLTEWLIKFLSHHLDMVDDDISEVISRVDPLILGATKEKLFKLIYQVYYKNQLWIPIWTSSVLGNFCSKKQYDDLKKDLKKTSNITQTFVHQGNVISIIDGMIKNHNPFITSNEKLFWKDKCIEFANDPNENGVLQRHSLGVLENYVGEENIISQVVEKTFNHPSSLVQEAFLTLCYTIAPNSPLTIKYLVDGIAVKDITIYGRYGLYKITEKEAILTLLESLATNDKFLEAFLDKESIFSFDRDKGDTELIKHIEEQVDPRIIEKLKEIAIKYTKIESGYFMERSAFFRQIVRIIQNSDTTYVYTIIDAIKKKPKENRVDEIIKLEPLLSLLLTPNNVKKVHSSMKYITDDWKKWADGLIYHANMYWGKDGHAVFEKAKKARIVIPSQVTKLQKSWEKKYKKIDVMEEFSKKLGTQKGKKYFLDVFKYYLDNKVEIEKCWSKTQRERLLWLTTVDNLDRIDPRQFKVTIPNKVGDSRQFTWSQQAAYFGSLVGVLKILAPERIGLYRQKIIDFIPYAYSDDQQMILELINTTTEKELEFVTAVYLNKDDDRRYLETSSYIYLIKEFTNRGSFLSSPPQVLQSFIEDPLIRDYERLSALETLALFIESDDNEIRSYLVDLYTANIGRENRNLTIAINALLIKKFKDREAIAWRFDELRKKLAFRRPQTGIVHQVGPEEDEINNLYFARPLIELNDTAYIPRFISLLKYSFLVLKKDKNKEYWEYVNYLWRIVIAFFDVLKSQNSLKPLIVLKKFVLKNTKNNGANWFESKLKDLTRSYINEVGKILD